MLDSSELDKLRYPIGTFDSTQSITAANIQQFVQEIEALPALMRRAVTDLTDEQLNTPYRPGGWTVRQVVHHVADSHINSYVRFKLALTEDYPTIKPYEEHLWAELPDAKNEPVEVSLNLLEALHQRWVVLLRSFSAEDWERGYLHPESGKTALLKALGLYAWHGRHHLAHITSLRTLQNW